MKLVMHEVCELHEHRVTIRTGKVFCRNSAFIDGSMAETGGLVSSCLTQSCSGVWKSENLQ